MEKLGQFYQELKEQISGIDERGIFIQIELIPAMDQHRRRTTPLASEEVFTKLFSVDLVKPGGMVELLDQVRVDVGRRLSLEYALEIADVVYYQEQPSVREYLYQNPDTPIGQLTIHTVIVEMMEKSLGVVLETASLFCIAKYLSRIHFDQQSDFKSLEEEVLRRLLVEKGQLGMRLRL